MTFCSIVAEDAGHLEYDTVIVCVVPDILKVCSAFETSGTIHPLTQCHISEDLISF